MGLGTVTTVKPGRVSLVFFKTGETVTYATRQAPLRRVIFEVGDSVRGEELRPFLIEGVREEEGLLHYQGADGIDLCETDLAAALSFDKPEARLMSGNPDESGDFSLRFDRGIVKLRVKTMSLVKLYKFHRLRNEVWENVRTRRPFFK